MRFVLIIFILVNVHLAYSQKFRTFSLDECAIGAILKNNSNNGVAFIVGNKNWLMTAAHVIDDIDSIYFRPMRSKKKYLFIPLLVDEAADIALLSSSEFKCAKPLRFDTTSLSIGDSIRYIGLDRKIGSKKLEKMCIDHSVIFSEGIQSIGTFNSQFIEFESNALPGYSGGPVIDINGNVRAIMVMSYCKSSLRNINTEVLITTASPINPIIRNTRKVKTVITN